jgi:hypothetical protein
MRDETRDTGLDPRVVGALRGAEILPADFEARLIAQAEAEIAHRRATRPRRSWWLTGRVFIASPLSAFAAAAAIAVVAALSTLAVTRGPSTIVSRPDTVEYVRFVLIDSAARSVSIVGDFNEWRPDKTPLIAPKPGVWSVSLPLSPGRHEYAFIVDGKRWVVDPASIPSSDEFGTESSVLLVAPTKIGAS